MDFLLPTPEVKEKVRKEFGLNDRRVKEALDGLKNWLEMQPHLPKVEGTESSCLYWNSKPKYSQEILNCEKHYQ